MNLRALADHKELAEHVTGLAFTSCYVPSSVPGALIVSAKPRDSTASNLPSKKRPRIRVREAGYLSPTALRYLSNLRQKDAKWDSASSKAYVDTLKRDTDGFLDIDPIIIFLADRFRSFPKLQRVAYGVKSYYRGGGYDSPSIRLPARYDPVVAEIAGHIDESLMSQVTYQLNRQAYPTLERTMGLDRFVHALQVSGQKPRELEIVAERMSFGNFSVCTSRTALNDLLQHAQTLVLSSERTASTFRGAQDIYFLSSSCLPNVTHLVLDCTVGSLDKTIHTPASLTWPAVTRLTLRSGSITGVEDLGQARSQHRPRPHVHDLVNALQSSLKHLTLINVIGGPWDAFLAHMQSKNLEKLEIILEDPFCEAASRACVTIPDKDALFAATTTVDMSYEYRMMCETSWSKMNSRKIVVGQLRDTADGSDFVYVPSWRGEPHILGPWAVEIHAKVQDVKNAWARWKVLGDWLGFCGSRESNYLR
jgi:hypothetical protein